MVQYWRFKFQKDKIMTRRVVVTGMGALSPLGRGLKANWNALF